jgi:glycosyltransferase involved in cell wall biosynthesis
VLDVEIRSMYPRIAAGPRVRIEQFAPFLAPHGIRWRLAPVLSDSEYLELADGTPLRKAHLIARAAWRARAQARRHAAPLELTGVYRLGAPSPVPGIDPPSRLDLYDFDDALHLGDMSAGNAMFSRVKSEPSRWGRYIAGARQVVAGNRFLADAATAAGARTVEVVPTCVDPTRYAPREPRDGETVVVGWMGSPSTVEYLDPVIEALVRLNRDRARFELRIVGGGSRAAHPWIRPVAWTEEGEPAELAGFDIGVMPLPDTPWSRGKCGYKLLQYMAAGVPAVGSPFGVNASILHGGAGVLASTTSEWMTALADLGDDLEMRRQLAQAGRDRVEASYSFQSWAPEYATLVRRLA